MSKYYVVDPATGKQVAEGNHIDLLRDFIMDTDYVIHYNNHTEGVEMETFSENLRLKGVNTTERLPRQDVEGSERKCRDATLEKLRSYEKVAREGMIGVVDNGDE